MRYIVMVLSLSFLMSCSQASKPAGKGIIVEGICSAAGGQWLYLVKPDPWQVNAVIFDSSQVDEEGRFSFKANLDGLTELMISGRGFYLTTFFSEPGDKINIEANGSLRNPELVYSGSKADVNRFWKSFSSRFFGNGGFNADYRKTVAESDPSSFQANWKNVSAVQFEVLDSFSEKNKGENAFIKWATSYVTFNRYSKFYAFLFHKPQLERKQGVTFIKVEDAYYDFEKEIDLADGALFGHRAFNDYMYAYVLNEWMRRNDFNLEQRSEVVYKELKSKLSGTPQSVAIAHLLKDIIEQANSRSEHRMLKGLMADFEDSKPAEKYISFIQSTYREKATLVPGAPAPDFTLTDMEGANRSLSEFKGKVVVIDFWGTWCGPCKRELPYSKKIEERFAERDDLVFLFVALERGSKDNWKQFVIGNELPGVHLFMPNTSAQLAPYKITSVPRYAIVDKEGNIFNAFASRPSQNMEQQINQALSYEE